MRTGFENLHTMLIRHEGIRLKPYTDSVGKLTIGVGRNLSDIGISNNEAMSMLASDIQSVSQQATSQFPWFTSLDVVRQDAVLDMIFNLGIEKFKKFTNTIEYLKNQNYLKASQEVLASRWASQVGERAKELSYMLANGSYPIIR